MANVEVKFCKRSDKDLIDMFKREHMEPSDEDVFTTSFMFQLNSNIKMQKNDYLLFDRFTAKIDSVSLVVGESDEEESFLSYRCHNSNITL